MKKVPTLFERDWNGNPGRVTREVHPGCEWVVAGEGRPTRKFDGTCCMIRDCRLYKRRELRKGEVPPANFEAADTDGETGKTVGWMPVGDGPEDRYHRDAFASEPGLRDGTYELIGPKVQGNPEKWQAHQLIEHGAFAEDDVPRDFDGLAAWLVEHDVEGIVWHHPDGRMVKIKGRDFGLKRSTGG
jgi:hypothetical protein